MCLFCEMWFSENSLQPLIFFSMEKKNPFLIIVGRWQHFIPVTKTALNNIALQEILVFLYFKNHKNIIHESMTGIEFQL